SDLHVGPVGELDVFGRGLAEASAVEADDVVVVREGGDDGVPHAKRRNASVDEQQRRRGWVTIRLVVERGSVNIESRHALRLGARWAERQPFARTLSRVGSGCP